jgi:ATP adenylyltransferase
MEYVESDKSGECIFCDLRPELDRDRLVLHRGQHVFVLLNRYPYSAGHLMVAPYAHGARLEELEPEVHSDLMARIADGARVLQHAYRCDGLNIGANVGAASGAGYADHLHFHVVPRWSGDIGANVGAASGAGYADHLHFHVVPRWSGDTNFMTVVGETSVIPQHVERIFDELAAGFRELSAS